MNKSYRLVFNTALGLVQAVSELARARVHGGCSVKAASRGVRLSLGALAFAISASSWAATCPSTSAGALEVSSSASSFCSLINGQSLTVDTGAGIQLSTSSSSNSAGAVVVANTAGSTIGDIVNNGSLINTLSGSRVIELSNGVTLDGAIINTGTMSSYGHAIELGFYYVTSPTAINGYAVINASSSGDYAGDAIYNSGTIQARQSGWGDESALRIAHQSVLNGNIVNDGYMSGYQRGINIASSNSVVNGSIVNEGEIVAGIGGTTTNTGTLGSYGIYNVGTISIYSGTGTAYDYSIYNAAGASIIDNGLSGESSYGIYNSGTISSGIDNEGAISIATAAGDSTSYAYGIYNSGSISTIVNAGTISATDAAVSSHAYAIYNAGTIADGIVNSGVLDGAVYLGSSSLLLQGSSSEVNGDISGTQASSITVAGDFTAAGDASVGTISVENGGTLNLGSGYSWGGPNGGSAAIYVGSTTASSAETSSALNLSDGASLSGSQLIVGDVAGDAGEVTVSGNTTVLSISDSITVAAQAGSTGVLNIGAAATDAAAAAGTVTASSIVLGSGTATLQFNHTSDDYVFSPTISGSGSVVLTHGTTYFTADNAYSGETSIADGAELGLSGDGSISQSSLVDDGVFDISSVTGGASIVSLSGSGAVALGSQTLTLTDAADTFSGAIGGTGGMTIAAGTETLSGANTYTGATTVDSDAGLVLTGSLVGDVDNEGSTTISGGTVAGDIDNSGTLSLAGGTVSGSVDNSGSVAVASSGGSIGSLSGDGSVSLSGKLSLTDASGTFSGSITGDGALAVTGGTETLTGGSTFSGSTDATTGSTTSLIVDGTATLDVTGSTASLVTGANAFIGRETAGDSVLNITDGGTVTFDANAFLGWNEGSTGTVNVSGTGSTLDVNAILFVGNGDASYYPQYANLISYGTLNVADGGSVTATTLVVGNDTNGNGAVNVSGADSILTVNGSLYVNADGEGVVSVGDGGTIVAAGTISFGDGGNDGTGTFNLESGGTLEVGGTNGIVDDEAASYLFNLDGGTLRVIGSDLTTGVNMTLVDGSDSTIDTNGLGASLSGVLSGNGSLTKAGTGTLTLTGVNTYTGTTTIDSDGTVALSGSGSISDSDGVIDNGTLDISATDAGASLTTLSGDGAVTLGSQTL
ncbi:beta strand repeat-containing protein, partial [Frateuria aurantia]